MGYPYTQRGDYHPYSRIIDYPETIMHRGILLPQGRSPYIPSDVGDDKVCSSVHVFPVHSVIWFSMHWNREKPVLHDTSALLGGAFQLFIYLFIFLSSVSFILTWINIESLVNTCTRKWCYFCVKFFQNDILSQRKSDATLDFDPSEVWRKDNDSGVSCGSPLSHSPAASQSSNSSLSPRQQSPVGWQHGNDATDIWRNINEDNNGFPSSLTITDSTQIWSPPRGNEVFLKHIESLNYNWALCQRTDLLTCSLCVAISN